MEWERCSETDFQVFVSLRLFRGTEPIGSIHSYQRGLFSIRLNDSRLDDGCNGCLQSTELGELGTVHSRVRSLRVREAKDAA